MPPERHARTDPDKLPAHTQLTTDKHRTDYSNFRNDPLPFTFFFTAGATPTLCFIDERKTKRSTHRGRTRRKPESDSPSPAYMTKPD
jgi:hypothetical protein